MKNGFKPKNKIKSKDLQRSPRILGLGLIKLDFYLNLTDEIIKKYKIDLNSINSPKDLAFIAEDTFLLDLIQISSSDTLSNILLFLNKANTSKSFVELITLSPLRFHPDEEHMKKIFTHVTEHNYLFSNEISVTNVANKLSFAIKNGKKLLRYFELNTDYDPFSDELSDENKKETDEKMENLYKNNNEIKEVDEINEYKAKSFEKEDMGKSDMMNDINNENNFEKSKNNENEDEGNVNSKINEIEDNENNNLSKQIHDKDEDQENNNNTQKENDLENISEADINNNKNEILQNKNDELDFDIELEEIKEKKSPKKKEISIPSYVEFPDEENSTNKNQQDKNVQPSSFREPFDKKSKPNNSSQNQNEKNSLSKKDFLNNKNEDLKKTNRPVYESSDSKKYTTDDKSILKLVNIPAACEIEEYDFLFIDLEEFINFHANGLNLYEVAEFMKKISNNNKKPRIVVNYPNILISLNLVNLELLEIIISIISFTDIFLFEKKECLAFFSMLNQMNNEKDLSEKELIDYFFSEVPHQKNSVSKIALFLDELQVINVAEQKKEKIINNISYDIKLFPKINHYNHKLVEEYKKIMTLNNNYFKSIFFGGFFSSYIFYEDSYVSYLTGAETTKRILEIFKNKIDFPIDPEFYLVKLQKSIIEKRIDREKLRKKEEKFVLDCINKTNSLIKYYNPLFDDNLNAFFSSEIIRKQLKDKGFINTNGFVLYDSSYKNLLERPPKEKKRLDTSEREKHLLLAVKQNNVKFFLF